MQPRRWPRAVVVVCLGMLLGLLGAATPSPPPATAEVIPGQVNVDITQLTPSVTRPGDDIVIEGTLANGTEGALTSPRVQLVLQRHVPYSRLSLDAWLTGEDSSNSAVLTVQYLDDVPPGREVPFTITLPADRSPFSGALWGPRGIEVRAITNEILDGERTALLWYPDEPQVSAPTEISFLVPLTATPGEWAKSVDTNTPVATAAAARLTRVLEEVPDGVAWALDAALLENLSAEATAKTEDPSEPPTAVAEPEATTGSATSSAAANTTPSTTGGPSEPSGKATLTNLLSHGAAQRDVIALGYADTDYAALNSDAGIDLLLAGRERSAELLRRNGITILDDVAWPASADLLSVQTLATSGTRAAVIPADSKATTELLWYTPSGRTTLDTGFGHLDGVLWDGQLSRALSADHSPLQMRQSILAQTAVLAWENPDDAPGFLAALRRDVGTDPAVLDGLSQTVTALEDAPWVKLTNFRSLLGRTDTGEVRALLPAQPLTSAHLVPLTVAELAQAWESTNAFAEATANPSKLRDDIAPPILTGLSSALTTDVQTRQQVLDSAMAAVDDLHSKITVEPGSEVLLVSTSGQIPITLESTLSVDATVQVRLSPEDSRLRADETVTANLPAGGATTVRVPVSVIANGNVQVSAEVITPSDGNVLVTANPFQVRVRGDWEDIGTRILAGLLVIGLVIGLVRTIRKDQRRYTPAAPYSDDDASAQEAAPLTQATVHGGHRRQDAGP